MDAIELLTHQHNEVKDLFEQFKESEDADEKQDLFQDIADNLAAHATIEEKIFYPAVLTQDNKDLLTEAVEEHLSVKRIIADLLVMSAEDENFDAKIKVLQEQIEHHIKEEEGELFPKVKKQKSDADLIAMSEKMESLFEEEMAREPSEKVLEETTHAAPLQ